MLLGAHLAGIAIEQSMLGATHACGQTSHGADAGERLARRLEQLRQAGDLPPTLGSIGVRREDFDWLAGNATTQWTGTFNPRTLTRESALEMYETAF